MPKDLNTKGIHFLKEKRNKKQGVDVWNHGDTKFGADHFRNSRLQPENWYFVPSNKRVLNRCLHTPGGRAELPSVRLYSSLKKLCRKGSLTYLATGDYAVPLVSFLSWKYFVSTVSAITSAFAPWSTPLPTSSYIASSPHSPPKVYHQKHGISRGQDSESKTFAFQWKAHRWHLTWLTVSSHCLVAWTFEVPSSFPAPVQAGSWIRRQQHHSGEVHEPPEKEHSRPFQEMNLLHPVYLLRESCRAVIFHVDTTNTY